MTCLWKRKEPVGRLEFPQTAQPTVVIFLIPEVSEKAIRRKFTAKHKLHILQEVDRCTTQGQIGALLRREGLYSSNLTTWRRQREQGTLEALSPKHRGPKVKISILPFVVLLNWNRKTISLNRNSSRQKLLLMSKKTLGNPSDTTVSNRRKDMMRTAESLAQDVHIKKACEVLGIPRASYYYYQKCKKTFPAKGSLRYHPWHYQTRNSKRFLISYIVNALLIRRHVRSMQRYLMKESIGVPSEPCTVFLKNMAKCVKEETSYFGPIIRNLSFWPRLLIRYILGYNETQRTCKMNLFLPVCHS